MLDLEQRVAAIWRALLVIDTNSFAITDEVRVGDAESWRLARAVYPVASLFNHSCRPSMYITFEGTALVARATRHAGRGEEATHCYGPQEGSLMCRERRCAT
jgi:hypothetical protein